MLRNLSEIHKQRLIWYYVALFLVAFVAMLPVTLLWHPLKWDMIDQYFPWRYLVGESIKDGILPLWNPYQLLGEPLHANPQSSAWYPITWLIGSLSGYNIYVISYDYFLHVFLAGTGMFFLGRQLRFRNETAFLMAVAYMLSGFLVGNAQHMTYIVSGAWIPFIAGAFIQLHEKPSPTGAVKLAMLMFMLLSGGYPSFTFILLYMLAALFIYYLSVDLKKKDYRILWKFSAMLVMGSVITVLMSGVVFVSIYHLQAAMTRGEGVTLEQALYGAFTPQCLVSFILPFAVTKNMDFFNTDMSMANAYFGLVPLAFFFVALTVRRTKIVNFFLAWGLFCLLAALGEVLPVRAFLYHYLPLMDQFRFPAAFRVFVILSFLIVAGFGFDTWMKDAAAFRTALKWILFALAAIILGFGLYRLFNGHLDLETFLSKEAFIFSEKSTLSQHIFLQSVIQLAILAVLYALLFMKKMLKWLPLSVLFLVCADMALATRLNGPYSIYYHYFNSREVYEHSQRFPHGFPLPDNESLLKNRDSKLGFQPFWRNMNIFHKIVSWDGYNPMQLKGYDDLIDHHRLFFDTFLENPMVYQSPNVRSLDSLEHDEKKGYLDPSLLYFNDEDYREISKMGLGSTPGDTVILQDFSPVKMEAWSVNKKPVALNLLQMNYHGWEVFVDDLPAKLYTSNLGTMSVIVPAGRHRIDFIYNPKDVRQTFYISLVTFLAGLGLLLFFFIRDVIPK